MRYIVVISTKSQTQNLRLLNLIKTLNYKEVREIYSSKIYSFDGDIDEKQIQKIASILLVDPVVEVFKVVKEIHPLKNSTIINIWYKPEVLDVEALYIGKAINYLGINNNLEIHSGLSFTLKPKIKKEISQLIVEKLFMNPLIQYYEIK